MCTIKFRIDNRSKALLKPIFMQINHKGKQIKRSTGIKTSSPMIGGIAQSLDVRIKLYF